MPTTEPLSAAFGVLIFLAGVGAAALVTLVLYVIRSFWQILKAGDKA